MNYRLISSNSSKTILYTKVQFPPPIIISVRRFTVETGPQTRAKTRNRLNYPVYPIYGDRAALLHANRPELPCQLAFPFAVADSKVAVRMAATNRRAGIAELLFARNRGFQNGMESNLPSRWNIIATGTRR